MVLYACIYPGRLSTMGFRPGTSPIYSFVGSNWSGQEQECVETAIGRWNYQNGGNGLPQFTPSQGGSPNVVFVKTALPGTTAGGTTAPTLDGDGYTTGVGVQFTTNTNYLESCDGFIKVLLHELGHAQGLADTQGNSGSSVMNQMAGKDDSGGNIPTDVTPCDESAAQASQPTDPCTYGCPPGYTDSCEGDQTRDPNHCNCCVNYTPILVDLGGNGFRMSSAEDGVRFAINSVASTVGMGWPLEPDDGWLALDRNGNGVVDNGAELFGNTTMLEGGKIAHDGYQALAEFDTNRDGRIDSLDNMFANLLIWSDSNRNAFSEPTELRHLNDAGIASISLDYHTDQRRDKWGNRFRYVSSVTLTSGRRVQASDVYPVPAASVSCVAR